MARRYGSGAAAGIVVKVALAVCVYPHSTSSFSVGRTNIIHPAHQKQLHVHLHRAVRLFSSTASSPADVGTAGVAGPPAIILDELTCTHDGGTKYQLDKVSYNLPRGKRIGLVGKNGAFLL